MSEQFQCGDSTALVGYLYEECAPAERAAMEAHIALCPACAAEIAALESARLQLKAWTPPESDLGFTIVRAAAAPGPESEASRVSRLSPGAWLRQPLPAWAQAVAACLIFGTGLSLGVLRGTVPAVTSVPPSPQSTSAQTSESTTVQASPVTATDLAALERRLRAEMNTLRAAPASTAAGAGNGAQLMGQVRALIEESEQRQQRELALRTAQVVRDFDVQRQMDLAQIQRNFGQIEGVTGAQVREQREMLDYLLRVSEQR